MVGLPARGKSYITKKIARYLNWLQHDTRIFNVGERRRVVAGTPWREMPGDGMFPRPPMARGRTTTRLAMVTGTSDLQRQDELGGLETKILINGEPGPIPDLDSLPPPLSKPSGRRTGDSDGTEETSTADNPQFASRTDEGSQSANAEDDATMDQSAQFFDPKNTRAAQIREQVAMATLDELLDYILNQDGSIGILDATNSTLKRRQSIMRHVRERAGPELGVLFLESVCYDKSVSDPESIMAKLSSE